MAPTNFLPLSGNLRAPVHKPQVGPSTDNYEDDFVFFLIFPLVLLCLLTCLCIRLFPYLSTCLIASFYFSLHLSFSLSLHLSYCLFPCLCRGNGKCGCAHLVFATVAELVVKLVKPVDSRSPCNSCGQICPQISTNIT